MRKLIPIALGALVGLSACAAPAATPTAAPAAEARPTIALPAATQAPSLPIGGAAQPIGLGVTASGEVAPRQVADLSFRLPGVVAELLVEEGQQVSAGQPLARLDARELELQVRQAEAGLAQARAGYERLLEGATPEEVAAAESQVAQAQAALRQAQSSVSAEDIAAAEAALQQALALQAEVEGGPKATDLQQAQAAVTQAQSNLQIQRTNLSAAKTNAELQLELAANQLRDAQQAYSDIYWRNRNTERDLDRFGLDLPQELKDAEEQALRAVQNAEARLAQAELAVDQARQNEVDGLAAAEAQLSNAEANLQRLLDGAGADQRAAVAAQVAQARSNLEKLRGDQRAAQLQAAQAGVSGAQANLQRVTADPTEATLAGSLAQVAQAEAAVEAARLNLEKATLVAPFAGVVATINVDIGDLAGSGGLPAVQVVDLSELRIEVSVSDTDVARVREGQPAEVRVDAVPGQVFTGSVSFIAPTATVVGNVRTYAVRITLEETAGLRAGMSARVSIQVE